MSKSSLPELSKLLIELVAFNDGVMVQLTQVLLDEGQYDISLYSNRKPLVREAACACGCPKDRLPETDNFDVAPEWHGFGMVDSRVLAKELGEIWGECFDMDISLGQLRDMAGVDREASV